MTDVIHPIHFYISFGRFFPLGHSTYEFHLYLISALLDCACEPVRICVVAAIIINIIITTVVVVGHRDMKYCMVNGHLNLGGHTQRLWMTNIKRWLVGNIHAHSTATATETTPVDLSYCISTHENVCRDVRGQKQLDFCGDFCASMWQPCTLFAFSFLLSLLLYLAIIIIIPMRNNYAEKIITIKIYNIYHIKNMTTATKIAATAAVTAAAATTTNNCQHNIILWLTEIVVKMWSI